MKEGGSEKGEGVGGGGVKIHPFHLPWIHAWCCFPDCSRDYLQLLYTKELFGWINDHKNNVSLEKRPR